MKKKKNETRYQRIPHENNNKKSKKIKRDKNNLIRENKRDKQEYFRARNPEYDEKIYKK